MTGAGTNRCLRCPERTAETGCILASPFPRSLPPSLPRPPHPASTPPRGSPAAGPSPSPGASLALRGAPGHPGTGCTPGALISRFWERSVQGGSQCVGLATRAASHRSTRGPRQALRRAWLAPGPGPVSGRSVAGSPPAETVALLAVFVLTAVASSSSRRVASSSSCRVFVSCLVFVGCRVVSSCRVLCSWVVVSCLRPRVFVLVPSSSSSSFVGLGAGPRRRTRHGGTVPGTAPLLRDCPAPVRPASPRPACC